MVDRKSYPTHEAGDRRDDASGGGAPCHSPERFLAGFFGGWGQLHSAGWHAHAERPEATAVRLRAIGQRAERLIREARAALPSASPEPAGAALAEVQVAVRELTALAIELAERASATAGTAPSAMLVSPGAEAVERVKRLTRHERMAVATALAHREQMPPTGAERRTLRVVPVEDRVVVQVRPPDDRRSRLDTYVLDREELLGLLPPEEASATQ